MSGGPIGQQGVGSQGIPQTGGMGGGVLNQGSLPIKDFSTPNPYMRPAPDTQGQPQVPPQIILDYLQSLQGQPMPGPQVQPIRQPLPVPPSMQERPFRRPLPTPMQPQLGGLAKLANNMKRVR